MRWSDVNLAVFPAAFVLQQCDREGGFDNWTTQDLHTRLPCLGKETSVAQTFVLQDRRVPMRCWVTRRSPVNSHC